MFLLVPLAIASLIVVRLLGQYPYHPDEGVSLAAAERILKGQVPYKDFFHITTPAAANLLAFAYKILGVNLVSARVLMAFILLVLLTALFFIGMRLMKNPHLVSLSLLFIIFLEAFPSFIFSTHRLAIFFSVLTLWTLMGSQGHMALVLAGFLTSCSILMNQNIGGFVLLGTCILAFTRPWFARQRDSTYSALKSLFLLCLGGLLPVLPKFFYLAWERAIGGFFYDTLLWPFSGYRGFNLYPYYSFEMMVVRGYLGLFNRGEFSLGGLGQIGLLMTTGFLPFIIYPFFLVSSFLRRCWQAWALSTMGLCTFLSSWNRPDSYHIFHTLSPFVLLSFSLLESLWIRMKRKITPGCIPFVVLAVLYCLILLNGLLFLRSPQASPSYPVRTERGTCFMNNEKDAFGANSLIEHITTTTWEGEPIFVYHWFPALYFLTKRENPTSFDSYLPLYNTPDQIAFLKTQLERSHPSLIIKDSYVSGFFDPIKGWQRFNFPMVDKSRLISEDVVDAYIQRNYTVEAINGPFTILRQKNLSHQNKLTPIVRGSKDLNKRAPASLLK